MLVTIEELNWCYPQDILRWISQEASRTGEYMAVEQGATGVPVMLLNVPDRELAASMIYAAMCHMPALPSFVDGWELVRADSQGNLFFITQRGEEYSNCAKSAFISSVKETWSRRELEMIWTRMRTP